MQRLIAIYLGHVLPFVFQPCLLWECLWQEAHLVHSLRDNLSSNLVLWIPSHPASQWPSRRQNWGFLIESKVLSTAPNAPLNLTSRLRMCVCTNACVYTTCRISYYHAKGWSRLKIIPHKHFCSWVLCGGVKTAQSLY